MRWRGSIQQGAAARAPPSQARAPCRQRPARAAAARPPAVLPLRHRVHLALRGARTALENGAASGVPSVDDRHGRGPGLRPSTELIRARTDARCRPLPAGLCGRTALSDVRNIDPPTRF